MRVCESFQFAFHTFILVLDTDLSTFTIRRAHNSRLIHMQHKTSADDVFRYILQLKLHKNFFNVIVSMNFVNLDQNILFGCLLFAISILYSYWVTVNTKSIFRVQ